MTDGSDDGERPSRDERWSPAAGTPAADALLSWRARQRREADDRRPAVALAAGVVALVLGGLRVVAAVADVPLAHAARILAEETGQQPPPLGPFVMNGLLVGVEGVAILLLAVAVLRRRFWAWIALLIVVGWQVLVAVIHIVSGAIPSEPHAAVGWLSAASLSIAVLVLLTRWRVRCWIRHRPQERAGVEW